jgi:hypothetical protein
VLMICPPVLKFPNLVLISVYEADATCHLSQGLQFIVGVPSPRVTLGRRRDTCSFTASSWVLMHLSWLSSGRGSSVCQRKLCEGEAGRSYSTLQSFVSLCGETDTPLCDEIAVLPNARLRGAISDDSVASALRAAAAPSFRSVVFLSVLILCS